MSLQKKLLAGMRFVFWRYEPRPYPKWGGFAEDAQKMSGDWRCLGGDMRKALKQERASRNG